MAMDAIATDLLLWEQTFLSKEVTISMLFPDRDTLMGKCKYMKRYNDNAHGKMNSKHAYKPQSARLIVHTSLRGGILFTTVDLSIVRNVSRNALDALLSEEHDSEEVEVTTV